MVSPFSRKASRLLIVAGLLSVSNAALTAEKQSARNLFKKGTAAEARDDVEAAYDYFHRAYQMDPADLRYKAAEYRTRVAAASIHVHSGERLAGVSDYKSALVEFLRALDIDPGNELAQQDVRSVQEKLNRPTTFPSETSTTSNDVSRMNRMQAPVELKTTTSEHITLHMNEDTKVVYQTICKLAGVNVIFDPGYTAKRVAVDLSDVTLDEALSLLATLSDTFWRPVTPGTIFVAQNTRAKRTELDQQGIQTFYLSNAAQQNDLNDVQTAIRNVLTGAKMYAVPSQNAIVMRGTPDELLLAQKCIDDLDKAKPEVVIDVAVIETSRDKLRNIGIQLPQSGTINLQASTSSSSSSSTSTSTSSSSSSTSSLTLNTLAHLNASNFAVTVGQAQAELLLTDSDSRILQNPRVRATDGQQATLKIGSRIPIATGSYSSGVSTGTVSTGVQTQFQYIDIGVNVDIKPVVHYDRDVSLKLKIEVSAHTSDTTISGVTEPIISQRTVEQTIRLKEGEANIIGGLLERDETLSVSGTPGLGEIPFVKYLFSTQQREVKDDEIVFMLIPHVVRGTQLSPLNLRRIDIGSGNSVQVRLAKETATPNPETSSVTDSQPSGPALPAGDETGKPAPPNQPSFNLTTPQGVQQRTQDITVAISLDNNDDIASLPLQLQFDPKRLSLVDIKSPDLSGNEDRHVAPVSRDDVNGEVTLSAAPAARSSSVLYLVRLRPIEAGQTSIRLAPSVGINREQKNIRVAGAESNIEIQ